VNSVLSTLTKPGRLARLCILTAVCISGIGFSVSAGVNSSSNPAPGLTISNKSKKEVVVVILDVKGRKFLEKNLGPIQGIIEFDELMDTPLPSGLYIIEVRISGEQPIKRLIIY